eukprot:CAMPEP_0183730774 /NCGR_PEP_ID=MMETSP0737-20130205/33649_1 /TAXON_ID=385413 /ORGANISM="Thalassiosira miniscula, Strain CCMP1093" /LENGTH=800 /DNA_ID=CAMNT_0025963355 /DNA_START=158 /DNA_END=2560 /DNA_ORIENTATION=+
MAEAAFLNMITKTRLDADHEVIESGDGKVGEDKDNSDTDESDDDDDSVNRRSGSGSINRTGQIRKSGLAVSGRSHFAHLVQAAVAKERLRNAISNRLSSSSTSINSAEARFLTKLVENKNVTLEALENAMHVLDNDPLYNPSMRQDAEFISEFNIGGPKEGEGKDDTQQNGNSEEEEEKEVLSAQQIKDLRSTMQRRNSGGQSCKLFDMAMDDASKASVDSSNDEDKTGSGEGRKRRSQRATCDEELNIWKYATGADSNNPNNNEEERIKEEGRDGMPLSIILQDPTDLNGSTRSNGTKSSGRRSQLRKASNVEKSMWKLVEANDDDNGQSLQDEESGLPLKSVVRGEAIDPLLAAVPVEQTPQIKNKKALNDPSPDRSNGAEQKVGLDKLLSSQGLLDKQAPASKFIKRENRPQSNASSIVEGPQDEVSSLMACCGMDLTDFLGGENYLNENNTNVAVATTEEEDDEDSLAAKKRYLHLDNSTHKNNITSTTNDQRRARLTTWLGSPEDYPILGVGKKKETKRRASILGDDADGDDDGGNNDGGEDSGDPLEPHVLSPLLMKCLRDHLPYALREENFWLKYSLVRDGASLEVIHDTMRHSHHTILAIETTQGEVFGSFTSSPWRCNGNEYYGSCEAFVWNLRKTRPTTTTVDSSEADDDGTNNELLSLDEYILRESSLEVFKWNFKNGNRNVQLSNKRKLFVGGGNPELDEDGSSGEKEEGAMQWGMALALDKELLRGTSSRCATFSSNSLIDQSQHQGSEVFEIMNMEIWALTPCMNEDVAEELELGRTFVMGFHAKQ